MRLLTQPVQVLAPLMALGTLAVFVCFALISKEDIQHRGELLAAITNCHCTRVGERHKLVCVYSLTDPLMAAATPPVSPLEPNLSEGLTGPG